ncbi:40S ribosomal protein S27 [Beauveria bassiana]|nr:40S ribosomal protein S27 [Beauveria bassiana]KAH8713369.1 40S ribosomal protein S27 [Beauveria bassiana]
MEQTCKAKDGLADDHRNCIVKSTNLQERHACDPTTISTPEDTRSMLDQGYHVLAVDLLNPSAASEAKKHKLKTLVPAPRSFFMDVKCPGCFVITTVFSHAQTVVICQGCTTVLCQPTGGKARLTEGCSFRRK